MRMGSLIDGRFCIVLPSRFPATFADAITLSHKLGLYYLWIHALCIVQDNLEEISVQINSMASIYTGARLCIAADAEEDVAAVLPGVSFLRMGHGNSIVRIRGDVSLGRANPDLHSILYNSTWNSQGWTFQEYMLSTRCLLFTSEEVISFCGQGTIHEGHKAASYHRPDDSSHPRDYDPFPNWRNLSNTGQSITLATMYALCTALYSGRQLSKTKVL